MCGFQKHNGSMHGEGSGLTFFAFVDTKGSSDTSITNILVQIYYFYKKTFHIINNVLVMSIFLSLSISVYSRHSHLR